MSQALMVKPAALFLRDFAMEPPIKPSPIIETFRFDLPMKLK
jgi:hypothetical protein